MASQLPSVDLLGVAAFLPALAFVRPRAFIQGYSHLGGGRGLIGFARGGAARVLPCARSFQAPRHGEGLSAVPQVF